MVWAWYSLIRSDPVCARHYLLPHILVWDDGELVEELKQRGRLGVTAWDHGFSPTDKCFILTTSVTVPMCFKGKSHSWPTPLSFPVERAGLRHITPDLSCTSSVSALKVAPEEGDKKESSNLRVPARSPNSSAYFFHFCGWKSNSWAWRKEWKRSKRVEVVLFAFVSFFVMGRMFLYSSVFISPISFFLNHLPMMPSCLPHFLLPGRGGEANCWDCVLGKVVGLSTAHEWIGRCTTWNLALVLRLPQTWQHTGIQDSNNGWEVAQWSWQPWHMIRDRSGFLVALSVHLAAGALMADPASQVLLGLVLPSQPLMYMKVLLQVVYELLSPTIGRNILGWKFCSLSTDYFSHRH